MSEQVNNYAASDTSLAETGSRGGTLSLSDRVRSLRLPETTSAGRSRSAWLPWLGCLLFASTSGYFAYLLFVAEPVARPDEERAGDTVSPFQANEPLPGRLALEAGGYVIPVRRVQVSPKVGGEVVDLFIEEGQWVKKGQVLAKLERTKNEFEYRRTTALADQAKAKYEKLKNGNREEEKKQAEATLKEAEEQRNQLRDDAERVLRSRLAASAEELFRSQNRLTQAEYKVRQLQQMNKMMQDGSRVEDIEEAKQAYQLALAQRDSAKYDLDNTDVLAPVSGVILKKYAEVGNTVRPEAYSNGLSASLCDMADLKALEVDVDISERDLSRVFLKQKCEIRTEAFPEKVYLGQVARLMPEANRSKASISARVSIEVPDNENMLRPEMRARVTFLAKGSK